MTNSTIKAEAKEKQVKLWEIAKKLGIADATFSRHLREEFSEEKKQEIISIIDAIASERAS